MGDDGADIEGYQDSYKHTYNAHSTAGSGIVLVERAIVESLVLKDDCFQIRCDVSIVREFPAVPPPDLHRPLIDLVATGMPGDLTFQVGGEHFTVHRCILYIYLLPDRSSVYFHCEVFVHAFYWSQN